MTDLDYAKFVMDEGLMYERLCETLNRYEKLMNLPLTEYYYTRPSDGRQRWEIQGKAHVSIHTWMGLHQYKNESAEIYEEFKPRLEEVRAMCRKLNLKWVPKYRPVDDIRNPNLAAVLKKLKG
ncbi:MAG: hypothetical protein K0U41_06550 [Gammaproteobacteria bacterium]|nr:hypothetical protein [Gammaproteobacteria bacterium]